MWFKKRKELTEYKIREFPIPADMAREITDEAIQEKRLEKLEKIAKEIKDSSEIGCYSTLIVDINLDDTIISFLELLGYKVKERTWGIRPCIYREWGISWEKENK